MNAILWLCEHGVHATYCTSSLLQVNLRARKCEEDGCQKAPSFGYPGGPRVRCGTHRLSGMVGSSAAVLCIPRVCCLRLRSHTELCSVIWCTYVGELGELQMRRRWLPHACKFWLPRRQASAVWRAQTKEHGAGALKTMMLLIILVDANACIGVLHGGFLHCLMSAHCR